MNISIDLNDIPLKWKLDNHEGDTAHIHNSFIIKKRYGMELVINLGLYNFYPDNPLSKRSMKSLINEWRAHNLLYSIGMFKSRTAHVDFESKQPWYLKIAYAILSSFYYW